MSSAPISSYDRVPYASVLFPQLDPARIAATARLRGFLPPDVRTARVLDIGCGSGNHVIEIARLYPQMKLIGIDQAAGQIELGRQRIRQLGPQNVSLYAGDLAQGMPLGFEEALRAIGGAFDYIICQGVYYVVPDHVRSAIWSLVRETLAERGIAHVSFNTYPGWKHREVAQDFAQFHAGLMTSSSIPMAEQSVREGLQQLAGVLIDQRTGLCSGYVPSMRDEAAMAQVVVPGLVFHEFLSGENRPLYFLQMNEQANRHQMAYLCEAGFPDAWPGRLGPSLAVLSRWAQGDALRLEQYIDFAVARTYRHSLWVRQTHVPSDELAWNAQNLEYVELGVDLRRVDSAAPLETASFLSSSGLVFSVRAGSEAVLDELVKRDGGPQWIAARHLTSAHPESFAILQECVLSGLVSAWL